MDIPPHRFEQTCQNSQLSISDEFFPLGQNILCRGKNIFYESTDGMFKHNVIICQKLSRLLSFYLLAVTVGGWIWQAITCSYYQTAKMPEHCYSCQVAHNSLLNFKRVCALHEQCTPVPMLLKNCKNTNNFYNSQQFSVKQIHIENQHLTEMSKK